MNGLLVFFFFFFQAEDGIRDKLVTGVQTCALPISSALRNLALELIRISNDLRLLSSGPNTGFAEIVLPALQPGSSIMPGKINPVMGELTDRKSTRLNSSH